MVEPQVLEPVVQDIVEAPVETPLPLQNLVQPQPKNYGPMEPTYLKQPQLPRQKLPTFSDVLETPVEVQFEGPVPQVEGCIQQDDLPPLHLTQPYPEKSSPLLQKIDENHIYRRHIPKQVELNQYIKLLRKKVIHDYNLPLSIKEFRNEYFKCPYFGDIYKYIVRDNCPFSGFAARQFKAQCNDYIVVEGLLFKLNWQKARRGQKVDPDPVLCIPRSYIPLILHKYHGSHFGGHFGVYRTYLTLKRKFWFPKMFPCIRKYILSCEVCQSRKDKSDVKGKFYARIPLDFRPMARISMDVKTMVPSKLGYKYLLLCTCEFSNWVEGIPIADTQATTIFDALYHRIIFRYGPVQSIVMDQASSHTSKLGEELMKMLKITPYFVSPHNHGSLKTERYIRTVNDQICKYLIGTGDLWPYFVCMVTFQMNTFVSTATGVSPYKLLFLQDPPDPVGFDYNPNTSGLSLPAQQYISVMKSRLDLVRQMVKDRYVQDQLKNLIRDEREHPNHKPFCVGDFVYLDAEYASDLHTPSKKLKKQFIGPLKVQGIVDDSHYWLSDWNGKLLPMVVHDHRLKPYHFNTNRMDSRGNLITISSIKEWPP